MSRTFETRLANNRKRLLALQSKLKQFGLETDTETADVLCRNVGPAHYLAIDYASEHGRTVVLQLMSLDGSTCLFDYRTTCLTDICLAVRAFESVAAGAEPEPIGPTCTCPLVWGGTSKDPQPDPARPDADCPQHGCSD